MKDTDTITSDDLNVAFLLAVGREPKAFYLLPQDLEVVDQKTYRKLSIKPAGEDALHSHLLLVNGQRINLLGLAARMAEKSLAQARRDIGEDCGC